MGQFDISYKPRTTIKGQTLVDFITEFTYSNTTEVAGTIDIVEAMKKVEMEKDKTAAKRFEDDNWHGEKWILYIDGASNKNGSGVGMMLISPKEHKIHCALRFGFQASNNEA